MFKNWGDIMFWIVQGLGLFVIFFTVISFLQKEKWKMFCYFLITNAFLTCIYFLCGSFDGGLLVAGATIKTIMFVFYFKLNRKPDLSILLCFAIYYIFIAIIFWSDFTTILLLINLLLITFTCWQNDIKLIRIGYIISAVLLTTYDIFWGAYTVAASEIIMLIIEMVLLVKTKRISYISIAQKWYKFNSYFWGVSICDRKKYDLVSSKIDNSPYYNVCILEDVSDLDNTLKELKVDCDKNNIKPLIYMPFNSKKYNSYLMNAHFLQVCFPTVFVDCWMKLVDGYNLNNTKCKLAGVEFKTVNEEKIEDIIKVFSEGYLTNNSDKETLKNRRSVIKHLKSLKFDNSEEIKIKCYVAYFSGKPVSLAFILKNKNDAFISKVSTIPDYRRKHIASSLIQFAITSERKKKVENFYLVTDKNSIAEKFYKFNNFKEFGEAFALDVSDMAKYEELKS